MAMSDLLRARGKQITGRSRSTMRSAWRAVRYAMFRKADGNTEAATRAKVEADRWLAKVDDLPDVPRANPEI